MDCCIATRSRNARSYDSLAFNLPNAFMNDAPHINDRPRRGKECVHPAHLLHILPFLRDQIIILQSHLSVSAEVGIDLGDRLEGSEDAAVAGFQEGRQAGVARRVSSGLTSRLLAGTADKKNEEDLTRYRGVRRP